MPQPAASLVVGAAVAVASATTAAIPSLAETMRTIELRNPTSSHPSFS